MDSSFKNREPMQQKKFRWHIAVYLSQSKDKYEIFGAISKTKCHFYYKEGRVGGLCHYSFWPKYPKCPLTGWTKIHRWMPRSRMCINYIINIMYASITFLDIPNSQYQKNGVSFLPNSVSVIEFHMPMII